MTTNDNQHNGTDRRAKLIFRAVAIVAAILIFHMQRGPAPLSAIWRLDVTTALAEAQKNRSPVLLFVMPAKQNSATAKMIRKSLNHAMVGKQLQDNAGVAIAAVDDLPEVQAQIIEKFGLNADTSPWLVVLDGDGKLTERRSGYVGPAEVRAMLSAAADKTK